MLNKRTGLREYDSVAESMDGERSKLASAEYYLLYLSVMACEAPSNTVICISVHHIFVKQMLSKFW